MLYSTPEEAIAVLAAIPDQIETLARQAGGRTVVSEEGEWTANEVVGHLADAARYWGARMFYVVREDEPYLPGVDQEMLATIFAHRYRTLDELLATFRLVSAGNVAFLRTVPRDAWERIGEHAERGRMTLREIVEVEADHEREHVQQLRHALGLPG